MSMRKASWNTLDTFNNNDFSQGEKMINNNSNSSSICKKIKNPLLFNSEEFIHKFDLVNMIPKNSILKVDEQKFISRGEVKKFIASKKNNRKNEKSFEKKLTPFQKNENYKNLLKEKLIMNKELLGEKAALYKRSYDNLSQIDPDELEHPSSSCTIFNFNSVQNTKNNFKEILLTKLRRDNSLLDLGNTSKEILPNIGFRSMSTTGFGNFLINYII